MSCLFHKFYPIYQRTLTRNLVALLLKTIDCFAIYHAKRSPLLVFDISYD